MSLAMREDDGCKKTEEYFVQLLNGDEMNEAGVRRATIRGNERVVRNVVREEIMGALKIKDVKQLVWMVMLQKC